MAQFNSIQSYYGSRPQTFRSYPAKALTRSDLERAAQLAPEKRVKLWHNFKTVPKETIQQEGLKLKVQLAKEVGQPVREMQWFGNDPNYVYLSPEDESIRKTVPEKQTCYVYADPEQTSVYNRQFRIESLHDIKNDDLGIQRQSHYMQSNTTLSSYTEKSAEFVQQKGERVVNHFLCRDAFTSKPVQKPENDHNFRKMIWQYYAEVLVSEAIPPHLIHFPDEEKEKTPEKEECQKT